MKISEIITDKYKLRIPPTVYYELLADVQEAEEEQEPKIGHWISRPHIYGVAFCSECGFELKINNTNYCPNCGCRMVEPQESEDKIMIETNPRCESCKKDWTKCGTCPVMMQWVKEHKHE